MRIMGLDVGSKRIGVAISDESNMIAQAKGFIDRTPENDAVKKIKEAAEKNGVNKIVVGLPINMDSSIGKSARDAREFSEKIKKATGLEIIFWDERLSTREAEAILLEADVSRKKRKKAIDGLAAQIILQGYLDSERNV